MPILETRVAGDIHYISSEIQLAVWIGLLIEDLTSGVAINFFFWPLLCPIIYSTTVENMLLSR